MGGVAHRKARVASVFERDLDNVESRPNEIS